MIRIFSIILGIFLASSWLGCSGERPSPNKPLPTKVLRSGKVFQYPFGVFWGKNVESPVIDSAQIEHTDSACPLVWVGDEAIDFSTENAETLQQKFGEQLKEPPNGNRGYDLTAVTKFSCVVLVNDQGKITSVYLYTRDEHRPCLSRTRESERLYLPCSAADLERCFGPPVKVTDF